MINLEIKAQTEIDEAINEFLANDENLWLAIGKYGALSKDTAQALRSAIETKDFAYFGLILYSQIVAYAMAQKDKSLYLS